MTELKKTISIWKGTALAVCTVIGSGLLGLPGMTLEAVGPWGRYGVSVVLCGTFTLGIPVVALIGGSYMQKLFQLPDGTVWWLAIGILLVATSVNFLGVKMVNLLNLTLAPMSSGYHGEISQNSRV